MVLVGPHILRSIAWWNFTVTIAYFLSVAINSRQKYLFGTIAKVFSPCIIALMLFTSRFSSESWESPAAYFLGLLAYGVVPSIVILETFYPKNTGQVICRKRNQEFLANRSFLINTAYFVVYVVLRATAFSGEDDPEFPIFGERGSETFASSVFLWMYIMSSNIVIFLLTMYWDSKEKYAASKAFEENVRHPRNNGHSTSALGSIYL